MFILVIIKGLLRATPPHYWSNLGSYSIQQFHHPLCDTWQCLTIGSFQIFHSVTALHVLNLRSTHPGSVPSNGRAEGVINWVQALTTEDREVAGGDYHSCWKWISKHRQNQQVHVKGCSQLQMRKSRLTPLKAVELLWTYCHVNKAVPVFQVVLPAV